MPLHPSRDTIEGNLMEGDAVSVSVLDMSMSLDGYIADPNDFLGGDDGNRLHEWFAPGGEATR
jgi:hypothetical protein